MSDRSWIPHVQRLEALVVALTRTVGVLRRDLDESQLQLRQVERDLGECQLQLGALYAPASQWPPGAAPERAAPAAVPVEQPPPPPERPPPRAAPAAVPVEQLATAPLAPRSLTAEAAPARPAPAAHLDLSHLIERRLEGVVELPSRGVYIVYSSSPQGRAGLYLDHSLYCDAVRDRSRAWSGRGVIPTHADAEGRRVGSYREACIEWLLRFGPQAPLPTLWVQ